MSFKVTLDLFIEGKHELTTEYQVEQQITIQEIFNLLVTSQQQIFSKIDYLDNKSDWVCKSKGSNKQYMNFQQTLDWVNDQELLTINIPQQQQRQNHQQSNSDLNNCQTHIDCPIQFICTDNHICQRRICAKCLHDEFHQGINIKNFQPLNTFVQSLQQQAQDIIDQKQDWLNYQKKSKDLEKKVENLIIEQKHNLDDSYKYYNKQFDQTIHLLECLQQQTILNFSNSEIYEMVQVHQSNLLKKQKIINNMNINTLQQNLELYESYVIKFSDQIKSLRINYVTIQQCIDQLEQDNLQLLYENQNLLNPLKTEKHFGKYMATINNLILDICTNSTLIKSLDYFIQEKTGLKDLSQFIVENSKNELLYLIPQYSKSIWTFHSRDRELTELLMESAYHVISYAICHDYVLQVTEECDDNNQNCQNCHFSCSINCLQCLFGVCQICDESNGWYLQTDNSCQPICGDNYIVAPNESCEDQNLVPFDRCDNCQLSCGLYCNLCAYGVCLTCEVGYTLTVKTNECISICGDQILTIEEECENNENGCYNCHQRCQSSCTKCSVNGCLECNTPGWQLDYNLSICEPICGDGIVIDDYEECDDQFSLNCRQCRLECQESCLLCVDGKCKKCKTGWSLNKLTETCNTISGDSLVLGNEQCDDSNQLDYDGCYLSKYTCQMSCETCEKGKCKMCQTGYIDFQGKCIEISNDGISIGSEQCDDGNIMAQDGCFNNRYDCPQYCQSCVKGKCLKCKSGYGYLDQNDNKCSSICGDGIVTLTEECDDGNTKPYDGCFNCKYQCHLECSKCRSCNEGYTLQLNQCVSVCGDQITTADEECDSSQGCIDCKYSCHSQCSTCVKGKCYKCQGLGWETNLVAGDCQPICGDGIVLGNEQCDDGNTTPEDGCYECYFDCQDQCTKCVEGYCQECNTLGWELMWNYCIPICGDKIVIQDHEECDDGNLVPYDGCYECKYQCQEQCTDCKLGICYACDVKGWQFINNYCQTNCGDSYIVEGYEDCDDGNVIPFDGCYQCQYQCEELCTNCYKGVCFECDILGWIIEDHKCSPFCGDGLIVGWEQCDDMNTDFEDGCDKCMFVCDQYCTDCQEGICMQFELGRYIQSNICVAQCGDGFYVDSAEKCDDGNDDNYDGCNSHCQIEVDWVCQNNPGSASNCFYSQKPSFYLQLETSNPEDFEIVSLAFDQKMQPNVQDTILNSIIFDILNLDNSCFLITPSLNSPVTFHDVSEIIISIKINFYVPVDDPILSVKFINDPVLSQYNLTLKQSEDSLKLLTPMVLSSGQKAIDESASTFNAALCLMTGSSELFWNLMDQLQYLSYIKYINIQFPNNLNIYFDVFKLISVSPLLTILGIDQIFGLLDGSADYYVPTQNKFLKDEINGYFLTNFQSSLVVLIGAIFGCLVTQHTHKFLYRLGIYHLNWLPFRIQKFIYELWKQLKKRANSFFYNGLLRILLSNCYDISFSCAIQIAYYSNENTVFTINYYCAIFVLIAQAGFTLYLMGVTSKFSFHATLRSKSQYQELFEGVQKSTIWTVQYQSIMLIKKQLFIYLIVFMQQEGSIQSLSIAFLQTLFLTYLFLNKPITSYEYQKSLASEILIIFNAVTFIFYSK